MSSEELDMLPPPMSMRNDSPYSDVRDDVALVVDESAGNEDELFCAFGKNAVSMCTWGGYGTALSCSKFDGFSWSSCSRCSSSWRARRLAVCSAQFFRVAAVLVHLGHRQSRYLQYRLCFFHTLNTSWFRQLVHSRCFSLMAVCFCCAAAAVAVVVTADDTRCCICC